MTEQMPLYSGRYMEFYPLLSSHSALYFTWLQQPNFNHYKPYLKHLCHSQEQLQVYLALKEHHTPPLETEIIVFHKQSQTPIGVMSLANIDDFNHKAEFSVGFIRGKNTKCVAEAIYAGISLSFSSFNLYKLIFYVAEDNYHMLSMLKRYNFISEGCFHKEIIVSTTRRINIYRFALFYDEWNTHPLRQRFHYLLPLGFDNHAS